VILEDSMKRLKNTVATALLAAALGGCVYTGAAYAGDNKVVILRSDFFLYGLMRKVFVCEVTEIGIANCMENQNP
jgi:hypothetical protein